jgi:hypothetical protein
LTAVTALTARYRRVVRLSLAVTFALLLGISIHTTVTVMNPFGIPQKALQAFWAQDFTPKLLNPNILVLYFPLTC